MAAEAGLAEGLGDEDGVRVVFGAELGYAAEVFAGGFAAVVVQAVLVAPAGDTHEDLDDVVHLWVKDTGVGIPPVELTRIFERFYVLEDTSLHRSSKTAFKGGGLGLGLAVAKGIIEAHDGKIWAESPGHDEEELPGSTFHILLPVGDAFARVTEGSTSSVTTR